MDIEESCYLGTASRHGHDRPFLLPHDDRLQHVAVLGKTGVGKSTLLWNLLLQEIAAGRGVGLIDPHGDLAEQLLEHIPSERVHQVCYFNPADREHPIGFNLFARVPAEHRPLVAADFVASIRHIYAHSWGDRLEWVLLNATLALLDYPACPGASILGIPRMLTDENYRDRIVRRVQNPTVRTFWRQEFRGYAANPRFLAEVTAPVLNKIGQLAAHPALRNILGQAERTFDPRFLMDNRRIFIANLAKGRIGEKAANLLGALLVSGFQHAAMQRADTPESERVPFGLVVDEVHNFATDSFASILSEARKMGLGLTIATQFLDQLSPVIRSAVIGNIGTLVVFRLGTDDADALAKEFHPYTAEALSSLPPHQAYIKPLAPGGIPEPVALAPAAPLSAFSGHAASIIRFSRERYTRPRARVEAALSSWYRPARKRG